MHFGEVSCVVLLIEGFLWMMFFHLILREDLKLLEILNMNSSWKFLDNVNFKQQIDGKYKHFRNNVPIESTHI